MKGKQQWRENNKRWEGHTTERFASMNGCVRNTERFSSMNGCVRNRDVQETQQRNYEGVKGVVRERGLEGKQYWDVKVNSTGM